jgi:hypothetical protein
MGKLLTILGISEDKQLRLPKKILQAEKIIAGLQTIYLDAPESSKKDALADTIAETTRLLLAEINNVKLEAPMPKEEPKEEPTEQPQEEEIAIGDIYQSTLDTWRGIVRQIQLLPLGKTIIYIETIETKELDPYTKETVLRVLKEGTWVKLTQPSEEREPEPQEQPQPMPQPKPKRKSRKKKEEPQPSAYPENDDYKNWSQEQLTAKRNEIIETITFFEQNGIDTEELQLELDEINLYTH